MDTAEAMHSAGGDADAKGRLLWCGATEHCHHVGKAGHRNLTDFDDTREGERSQFYPAPLCEQLQVCRSLCWLNL